MIQNPTTKFVEAFTRYNFVLQNVANAKTCPTNCTCKSAFKFPPKMVTSLPTINKAGREVSRIFLHYFSFSFLFLLSSQVALSLIEPI